MSVEVYKDDILAFALATDSEQVNIEGITEKHMRIVVTQEGIWRVSCTLPGQIIRHLSSANIFEILPSVMISDDSCIKYGLL